MNESQRTILVRALVGIAGGCAAIVLLLWLRELSSPSRCGVLAALRGLCEHWSSSAIGPLWIGTLSLLSAMGLRRDRK